MEMQNNPSFQKILSDTDVKKQMAVDSKFVQYLPRLNGGGTVNIDVMDANSGKMYKFAYYVRKEGHPKPAFQGGWRDYCRDKGLQAGDSITFSAKGGNFIILAERETTLKLFGKYLRTVCL